MTTLQSQEIAYMKPVEISEELIKTWVSIAFRIYDRMIEKMDDSFFMSVPQIISNLAFLVSACDSENTIGIMREFNSDGNQISKVQTRELLDQTLDFLRVWGSELHSMSKPGHILITKRALSHPKYSKAYTFNTFKALRHFEVELKIYEGKQEVFTWLGKNLKTDIRKSECLNLWADNTLQKDAPIGKNDTLFSKITASSNTPKENKFNYHELRESKKPPILVWASHVTVAINPDIFEASNVFSVDGFDCIRIHDSPKTKIKVINGDNAWSTLILPTANKSMKLIIMYDYGRIRLSLNQIREVITKYEDRAPVLIKQHGSPVSQSGKIEQIYIPCWNSMAFAGTNVADHYLSCLDMNSIFYTGGFGDLAIADAEPCASPNPLKISHIQFFNILSLVNSPHLLHSSRMDSKSDAIISVETNSKRSKPSSKRTSSGGSRSGKSSKKSGRSGESQTVPLPFSVILWDSSRKIPVYMGKINSENTRLDERSRENKKSGKFSCTIC